MAHNVKLETLSMDDLQQLVTEAQKVLADKADTKRKELLEQLAQLDSLTGKPVTPVTPVTRVRQSPKPMYRAPDGYEWSGRGAIPRVFKELGVTDKKDMDKYLIKD